MHPVSCKNSLFPLLKKYHWSIYVVAVFLVILQFLQLHRASGFFSDDLNVLVLHPFHTLSDYIASWTSVSTPNYRLISDMLSVVQDPFYCHMYILGMLLVGSLVFIYVTSLFGIPWIFALLMINIPLSLPLASEPVYFISSFHFTVAWTLGLVSFVLFLHTCMNSSAWKASILFVLSVFAYWMSVATTPQYALLPLSTLLIVLIPVVYDPIAHLAPKESGGGLTVYIKTFVRQLYKRFCLCLFFIVLTTGAFLIRQFIFGIEYHYYEIGWVDNSLGQALRGGASFFLAVVRSFNSNALTNFTPPPLELLLAAFLTLIIYAFCFVHYCKNTPAMISHERSAANLRLSLWTALLFLVIASVTVFPVVLIINPQARYFMGPSIFLVAAGLTTLYGLIEFFFVKSPLYKTTLSVCFFALLSCLLLSTYNRYIYVENTYVAKANIYNDFEEILKRDVDIENLSQGTQLIILDHDASMLTKGYDHWSAGLLKLITGRRDINGVVLKSNWYTDPFSHVTWRMRKGKGHRKKAVGFERNKPLKIYKYMESGFLMPMNYMILKEESIYNLYKTGHVPILIQSSRRRSEMMAYLRKQGIASSEVWLAKPYPDGFFDQVKKSVS